jgi:hypothetical protein
MATSDDRDVDLETELQDSEELQRALRDSDASDSE